jgi:mannosyl-oligosaccharide alpha-1,2-mannosidase
VPAPLIVVAPGVRGLGKKVFGEGGGIRIGGVGKKQGEASLSKKGVAAAPATDADVVMPLVTTSTSPREWADITALSSPLSFVGGPTDSSAISGGVSGGAWIFLDSSKNSKTINMILSNRASGCAVDDTHRGFSFFVNTWETNDQALLLEWRDSRAGALGCGRLASKGLSIPLDTWVHVAFTLEDATSSSPLKTTTAVAATEKAGKARLFLNGVLLIEGESWRTPLDSQAAPNAVAALTIGSSSDGTFPLTGRMAQTWLLSGIISPLILYGAMTAAHDSAGFVEWIGSPAVQSQGVIAALILAGSVEAGGDSEGALLETPAGLSSAVIKNLRRVPRVSVIVGDLENKLSVLGTLKLPTAEEVAAEALAAVAALAAAAKAAELLGAGPDGVPRSRRNAKQTGSTIPDSIVRKTGLEAGATTKISGSWDFTQPGNQWLPFLIKTPAAEVTGTVKDKAALAAGTNSDEFTAAEAAASDAEGRVRAEAVKEAMKHVWSNYEKLAWGMDELKPVSGHGDNNWAGLGMTIVDSLDTLWIMGLMDEFNRAKEWVAQSLSFDKPASISVFEVTIRVLGGLLAAFDLSADPIFLKKAEDLGARLLPAFNTPSGIPRASVHLQTGQSSNPGWTGGSSILSELGTLQVEFRYLSRASGRADFGRKAEAIIETLDKQKPAHGLYPIYVSADTGQLTTGVVAFGALGDSFFEYLIKVWVQGDRKEPMYRRMYDAAMDGMYDVVYKRSKPSNLAYIADFDGANTQDKMDHLVCFVPGMLALGAYNAAGTAGEKRAVKDLAAAKALAYTCWQMYERQATGIGAEFVEFPGGGDLIASQRAPFYILRPEAAEALFVLHQVTGNPIYREWGWRMFQAIDKHCKTKFGYGAHPDVRDTSRTPDDRMER